MKFNFTAGACQQRSEAGNLSHFATKTSDTPTPTMAELEQKLKNRLEEAIRARDAQQVGVASNDCGSGHHCMSKFVLIPLPPLLAASLG